MDAPIWAWAAVVAFILALLAFDLFVFHREAHEVSTREAALSSAVWVSIGLAFGVVLWVAAGGSVAGEYYAGYLIEKSLSVDNIFVIALILGYFAVPAARQHRVLFWGVLGALVMRAVFIVVGAALLDTFHWMIFVFGGFLVVTGIRMARHDDAEVHPDRNPVLRVVRRVAPRATPVMAALVAVETTDLVFAADSIPAVFAVTDDAFVVFTSNAFAILGLRALYFLLAGMMSRFAYLKLGLAAVLVFVGFKMILADVVHVPVAVSLLVIASILGTAVVASLRRMPRYVGDGAGGPGRVARSARAADGGE
jgi:tellurite resistance protein TerC